MKYSASKSPHRRYFKFDEDGHRQVDEAKEVEKQEGEKLNNYKEYIPKNKMQQVIEKPEFDERYERKSRPQRSRDEERPVPSKNITSIHADDPELESKECAVLAEKMIIYANLELEEQDALQTL